ncbi:MAG: rRNA adenine N-6-methyltransferase family protein, partial [Armatimonadia bacterium]
DFLPPPSIDSTAVRLVKRAVPPFETPSAQSFSRTVKAAFIHRRKALRAALKQAPQLSLSTEQVQRALDLAGLEGERRAETLDMDEFARLALALEEVEKP